MDIIQIGQDFSTYMNKLDELNKNLIQQIKDSQTEISQVKGQLSTTKELLVKTQNKFSKCRNENKMLKNQSVRHRKHMKSNHDATKAKEQEWITFTKYLKTFHNGCTCQPKNKSMIQPTELEQNTSLEADTSTTDLFVSPSPPKHRTPPRKVLSPRTSPRPGISKLKRIKAATPKSGKKPRITPRSPTTSSPVLYAANTPEPDEGSPGGAKEVCPDSPVFDLVDMSQTETLPTQKPVNETPPKAANRQPKKFNLLTECKADISISEELLGFSLPDRTDDVTPSDDVTQNKHTRKLSGHLSDDDSKAGVKRVGSSTNAASKSSKTGSDFNYVKTVRKKEDRLKMAAAACITCYEYYKTCGLGDEEIAELIGDVSRHRHHAGQHPDQGHDSMWDLTICRDPMPAEPATQRVRRNRYISDDDVT